MRRVSACCLYTFSVSYHKTEIEIYSSIFFFAGSLFIHQFVHVKVVMTPFHNLSYCRCWLVEIFMSLGLAGFTDAVYSVVLQASLPILHCYLFLILHPFPALSFFFLESNLYSCNLSNWITDDFLPTTPAPLQHIIRSNFW